MYIGKKPTPAPLTSSDIAADIINSTHIGDTAISGFDALASEPANTDEFLISDGGVLKRLDASLIGGGKIGQVLQTQKIDQFSTTNGIGGTGFTDVTGLSQAITPSATSSKILILLNFYVSSSSDAVRQYYRIEKGGTAIGLPSAMSSGTAVFGSQYNWHSNISSSMVTLIYLDSPNTTSATTYNLAVCNNGNDGGATLRINFQGNSGNSTDDDNGQSNITLMEVLA